MVIVEELKKDQQKFIGSKPSDISGSSKYSSKSTSKSSTPKSKAKSTKSAPKASTKTTKAKKSSTKKSVPSNIAFAGIVGASPSVNKKVAKLLSQGYSLEEAATKALSAAGYGMGTRKGMFR